MNQDQINDMDVTVENSTNVNPNQQRKEKDMEDNNINANGVQANIGVIDNMKIEMIDVDCLIIDYHPRKNLGDLKSLEDSMRRDGLQEPLLVRKADDGKFIIIDGCRRYEVIKSFGWKSVLCMVMEVENSEAAHLSFVKNSERKNLDAIEIALHLKAMQNDFGYSMRDLELKGYGSPASISKKMKLLELPETIQDQIQEGKLTASHGEALLRLPSEEEQENMAKRIMDHEFSANRADKAIDRYIQKGKKVAKPKVQIPESDIPGVYFKDSKDMSELPDKSVHLIVSSPPYNVGKEFEKGVPYDEHIDNITDVLNECAKKLVMGGIVALNVADILNFKGAKGKNDYSQIQLMGSIYQKILRKHNIYLTDKIIWVKRAAFKTNFIHTFSENTAHASYRFMHNHEPVYIFRKKGKRKVPPEKVVLKSRLSKEQWKEWIPAVWEINAVQKMEGHPSIYPDELCHRLIKMFSYEGDTVLDPWLGSGTTVKVARELNRVGIGYEREVQYKEVIMKKLGVAVDKSQPQEPQPEFFTNMTDADIQERMDKVRKVLPPSEKDAEEVQVKTADEESQTAYADDYLEEEYAESSLDV